MLPLLPGDSLLFAAGSFAALGSLIPWLLFGLLASAAIVGDNVNYWVGRHVGPRAFSGRVRFLKVSYLDRTRAFFARHGTRAIILARFIPIIRTFTPFVAGIGAMTYRRFLPFDLLGGLLWVGIFVFGGYFFGNLEVVRSHFSIAIMAIILVSLLPGLVEYARHRRRR